VINVESDCSEIELEVPEMMRLAQILPNSSRPKFIKPIIIDEDPIVIPQRPPIRPHRPRRYQGRKMRGYHGIKIHSVRRDQQPIDYYQRSNPMKNTQAIVSSLQKVYNTEVPGTMKSVDSRDLSCLLELQPAVINTLYRPLDSWKNCVGYSLRVIVCEKEYHGGKSWKYFVPAMLRDTLCNPAYKTPIRSRKLYCSAACIRSFQRGFLSEDRRQWKKLIQQVQRSLEKRQREVKEQLKKQKALLAEIPLPANQADYKHSLYANKAKSIDMFSMKFLDKDLDLMDDSRKVWTRIFSRMRTSTCRSGAPDITSTAIVEGDKECGRTLKGSYKLITRRFPLWGMSERLFFSV